MQATRSMYTVDWALHSEVLIVYHTSEVLIKILFQCNRIVPHAYQVITGSVSTTCTLSLLGIPTGTDQKHLGIVNTGKVRVLISEEPKFMF